MIDSNIVQLLIRAQLPVAEGGLARKSVREFLFNLMIICDIQSLHFQVYICTEGEAPTKRLKQMADHLAAGYLQVTERGYDSRMYVVADARLSRLVFPVLRTGNKYN